MKIMKNKKLIFIENNVARYVVWCAFAVSTWALTSCSKWLEEDPYSLYAAETYFDNTEDAKKAALGVYEIMASQNTYGFYMSLVFDIDSDLAYMEGTGFSNDNRTLAHYNFATGHNYITEAWRALYEGINRANLVIANIPQMDMFANGSEAEKIELRRCLAEAKFLRGLYYFDLVRLYGDVPLKTDYTKATDDMKSARTDKEEIYDQIIQDMTEAIPDIPEASEKPLDERISRGAAKGILARVYLGRGGYSLRQNGQMERPSNYLTCYEEARRLTKEIIDGGQHALNTSYETIFRNYCELKLEPKESMFEVAFFNPSGARPYSGYIGSWNSPLTAAGAVYGRANAFFRIIPTLYDKYDPADQRKDIAIARYEINGSSQKVDLSNPILANVRKWTPGKWRRDWQGTEPKDLNNTDINWVLLRYSDVLLMYAEAENEINGPGANSDGSAYWYLNMVRRRGFGVPVDQPSATADLPSGLSKEEFFEKIVEERTFELCYEGFRKFDLIRWNRLGTSLRAAQEDLNAIYGNFPYIAGNYFTDNKHELYPIPQKERDINQNLTQNPNY